MLGINFLELYPIIDELFAKEELKKIGEYAKLNGMGITVHPEKFNAVETHNKKVFEITVSDLKILICQILWEWENYIMNVHGGGTYGDKKETIKRLCDNFKRLSDVRSRLVLKNCEKYFSIIDSLEVNTYSIR